METSKHWLSLRRCIVMFVVLTAISRGSTCEAPSSPECFRRGMNMSMYTCEWRMNTTESDVNFDLFFNETKFGPFKQTSTQLPEERLIKHEKVFIWVEAHVGNSSCASPRSPVVLVDIIKYEAPQIISMSWLKEDLHLKWKSAENHPAFAEVRFCQHSAKSWELRKGNTKTNDKTSTLQVSLLSNLSYQVQIRQKSTHALHPLWSNWSSVIDVPAELKEKPEVTVKTFLLDGTRQVMLQWKPLTRAAITRVNYRVVNSQSAGGCPCVKKTSPITKTKHMVYVSYSPVNISVTAKNAAGNSPPAEISLPVFKPQADLKACEETLPVEGLKRATCLEWYEFPEGGQMVGKAIVVTGRQKKKEKNEIKKELKDFVRYLYFEHTCNKGRPRTANMCLFYEKEGAPLTEPKDFNAADETHYSTKLSWQEIPLKDRQGFLTHYSLCTRKASPENEPDECHNISATLSEYHLENLTPDTKYVITLAGVTRKGVGPGSTVTISTQPEKPFNVWWSLCLLFFFFLLSASCSFILKRFKLRLFPPVPTPVIDLTSYPVENQKMLEREEEVDELTILKLPLEGKSIPVKLEKTTEDMEITRGDSRMSGEISDEDPDCTDVALTNLREGETGDLEQLENVFALLIYRNGLVFDSKTDSP